MSICNLTCDDLYTILHFFHSLFFFFNDTATTEIYTLSLHDALPIFPYFQSLGLVFGADQNAFTSFEQTTYELALRSEEHTSELQSRFDLVCRLLLEKKKKTIKNTIYCITKYS